MSLEAVENYDLVPLPPKNLVLGYCRIYYESPMSQHT